VSKIIMSDVDWSKAVLLLENYVLKRS